MISFPHAKLNLGLRVTGKRSDGFHNIETVFYPISLTDILEIVPAVDHTFSFTTSGMSLECKGDNLCVQAYKLFCNRFGIAPVKIHLHKAIPSGAGLGGGSSDAAFCLLMLNAIFHLKIDDQKLMELAGLLGSDCPFFIQKNATYAKGRGNVFKDISLCLKGYSIVLVKPDFSINTAHAFSLIKPSKKIGKLTEIIKLSPVVWPNQLINEFEEVVFQEFPILETIKSNLYRAGAIYASMSGSGSCMFGIFNTQTPELQKLFPSCFVWSANLK